MPSARVLGPPSLLVLFICVGCRGCGHVYTRRDLVEVLTLRWCATVLRSAHAVAYCWPLGRVRSTPPLLLPEVSTNVPPAGVGRCQHSQQLQRMELQTGGC